MLHRTVIVICWICGFVALLMGIFGIPHTQVLVGFFWAWPAGWACGTAFAELRARRVEQF